MKVLLRICFGFVLNLSSLWCDTFILYDKHDPVSQNIVDGLLAVTELNLDKSQLKEKNIKIIDDTRLIEHHLNDFNQHVLLGIGAFSEHFINKHAHKVSKWHFYYLPLQSFNLSDSAWHNTEGIFIPHYRQYDKAITDLINKHTMEMNKIIWLAGLPAHINHDKNYTAHLSYQQHLPQQPVCFLIISDKIGQIGNLKLYLTTGDLKKFAESIDSHFRDLPIVIFEEHCLGNQYIKRRNKTIVARQYVNPLTLNLVKHLKALRKNNKSSVYYVARENNVDPQLALYHHLNIYPDSVLLLPDTMHKLRHELYRFGYTKGKKIILYNVNDIQTPKNQSNHGLAAQGFNKLSWKTNLIVTGTPLALSHNPIDPSKEVMEILFDKSARTRH